MFGGSWEFSVSEIESSAPNFKIESYTGHLDITPSQLVHSGRANISKLELKNDKYFIGQVENSFLDIELTGMATELGVDLTAQASLTLREAGDFSAIILITSSVPSSSVVNCLNVGCVVQSLVAKYSVSASGATLTGSLECEGAGCFNRPDHFDLRTSDTNKFFQALSNIGVLSPLVLPIAYLTISSGQPVGKGHLINF